MQPHLLPNIITMSFSFVNSGSIFADIRQSNPFHFANISTTNNFIKIKIRGIQVFGGVYYISQ